MKSPDEILLMAYQFVRKHNNGVLDPLAVTAYVEGYTSAWSDSPPETSEGPGLSGNTPDSTFDDFWNLYDKKVGKPKCISLWQKLTKTERKSCMQYIPLYKQAQPDKQFRKNPETFLRNKSWNDELIYRKSTEQPEQPAIIITPQPDPSARFQSERDRYLGLIHTAYEDPGGVSPGTLNVIRAQIRSAHAKGLLSQYGIDFIPP